jgi:hypothetical protein
LPRGFAQYGTSVQCAEPVTGSSGTPRAGAKNRETKSMGTVYRNMIVVVLEGVTHYNSYINDTPPFKWIIHPNWYTTAAFRSRNNGALGGSNGCITIDPVENNQLITRLQDGALVYVRSEMTRSNNTCNSSLPSRNLSPPNH